MRLGYLAALAIGLAPGQTITFLNQVGASEPEQVSGLAMDRTGVYLVGRPPLPPAFPGETDPAPFVRKTDFSGKELWTRRLGSSSYYGRPFAVAASGGSVYVAGSVDTGPAGLRGNEVSDAFVAKYDATGNELWTRRFGTSLHDGAFGVAVQATGVYVVGEAAGPLPGGDSRFAGVFIRKYDTNGNELWTRQDPGYGAAGVAVDATGVYMVGAFGAASGLRKYSADGAALWTRPIEMGSPDFESGLAADATGVYLARAGFLIKYNAAGDQLWSRKYSDRGSAVAVDGSGVYAVGSAEAALPGQCSAGYSDAVVRKYDTGGNLVWTRQFGTSASDLASGVAVDETGVYVAGFRFDQRLRSVSFLAKLEKSSPAVTGSGPNILWECVVNAASYVGGGVAPGEIVTIFGSALGPAQLTPLRLAEDRRLATTLADTRILFNGTPAPLLYVSELQSSAIVPYGVAGLAAVNVEVEYRGARSNAVTVPMVAVRPGLFTLDGSGRGQGSILNEDGSLNSPDNPARRGSIIVLYATGEGLTDPAGVDGQVNGGIPTRSKLPVSVSMGISPGICGDCDAVDAEVLYAGGVTGAVPGLLQVNVRVPATAAVGSAVPLYLSIGPGSVQPGVTVALR